MSLTHAPGPLAGEPGPSNYAIEGPAHRLLATPLPRRIRGELGGEVVIDTERAYLLHETGIKAQLYVPLADVRPGALTRTDQSTHCPFKGDASYRTITTSDGTATAENALWVYDAPLPAAPFLEGYAGVYLNRLDAWYDEDDAVRGFTDPYHRVDVRATSATVEVRVAGELVARSANALVLSETALPNRYYLPRADVIAPLAGPTETTTHCSYKGDASYWTLTLGDGSERADAAWSYETPLPESARAQGHVSFWGDDVEITATPLHTRFSST